MSKPIQLRDRPEPEATNNKWTQIVEYGGAEWDENALADIRNSCRPEAEIQWRNLMMTINFSGVDPELLQSIMGEMV